MSRNVIVIPARLASTRFHNKMLHPLEGHKSGHRKPLICWTVEAARRTDLEVYVATDSPAIASEVSAIGCRTLMTPSELRNGTERCAVAAEMLGLDATDRIINWQGDAPLIPHQFVNELLWSHSTVATPVMQVPPQDMQLARDMVHVAMALNHQALYFSRFPIPHREEEPGGCVHIGMYSYLVAALGVYRKWLPGPLEQAERLEQLRWLENRMAVRCVPVPYQRLPEFNTMHDIQKLEELL